MPQMNNFSWVYTSFFLFLGVMLIFMLLISIRTSTLSKVLRHETKYFVLIS